jgi:hypothetical protein
LSSLRNFPKGNMCYLILVVIAPLLMSACRAKTSVSTPSPTYPVCPTCVPYTSATVTVTPTPVEAPPSSWVLPEDTGSILPAPLYYLSTQKSENGQPCSSPHIVRIERDGQTRNLISPCFGTTGIHGFDISPIDATVVVVLGGRLWLTDKNGDNGEHNEKAKLLTVSLPDPEEIHIDWFRMQSPVWSPDGTKIAYADGGIRIIDIATGQRKDIIENVCYDILGFASGMAPCFYGYWYLDPKWSPDGGALIFRSQNADDYDQMIYELSGEKGTEKIIGTNRVENTNIAWSPDGKHMYLDDWSPHDIKVTEASFIQVGRNNSDVQMLWSHADRADYVYSSAGNNPYQVKYPFVKPDGKILFFQAEPCDADSCYHYDLVEGSLTSDGFKTRLIWENALPEGIIEFLWYKSGGFIAFSTSPFPYHHDYIGVMEVQTGKIYLLTDDRVDWFVINSFNLTWGLP